MTFLQPIYFWGLCALAIPIAIHLWSRKKVRTIKVGSTQFITETKSKQSNTFQLNEYALLALRCLSIMTLVAILAQPSLLKNSDTQQIAYLFEPSLLSTPEGKQQFQHIPKEGRRILAPGFPEWQEDMELLNTITPPNYWQLARQMDRIPADSIVVFTSAFAKAVKGKRPTISKKIRWVTVPPEKTIQEIISAQKGDDSIALLAVESNATSLKVDRKLIPQDAAEISQSGDRIVLKDEVVQTTIPLQNNEPVKIYIVYEKKYQEQLAYFTAAFNAITAYAGQPITLDKQVYNEGLSIKTNGHLVWLVDSPLATQNRPALVLRPDALAHGIIEPSNRHDVFNLTKLLTTELLVDTQFAAKLLDWLKLEETLLPAIDKLDTRVVSTSQLETRFAVETDQKIDMQAVDLALPLWVFLFVLLIGERVVAKKRKQ